ncbi:MAG TPA: MerR family transcriptional regulator [Streptomyces sp.]|uniref:MerR family transcriptional regulator n=1 Tax=Streptomyces sp. TaxID=1931 RepID=UPI002D5B40F7|nr:MerR family transcriptional regulator [Streptomyces sp.]HZG06798.1 MerR family transcriptional regulator [Streptomyces sp.]
MNEEEPLLTIGQLAGRTAASVRSIRYWSDIGVLTPERRSASGYRLYGADAVVRLDLIRSLRQLGLSLEEVRRVLRREMTVAEVAAGHVAAVDAQIRALKVNRAVLSAIARRGSTAEETALVNKLARLSADERRKIIEDFMKEVSGGLEGAPDMDERLRRSPVELPDNPSAEQVDAWLELAELISDPGFRTRMRRMLELNTPGRPGSSIWFTGHVVQVVGEARARGVDPEGRGASAVLTRLFHDADRAEVLEALQAGFAADAQRFRRLLSLVKGRRPRLAPREDYLWLERALRADLRRGAP